MKRLLNIEDGYNFRELGGYPTQDGHQVKFNRLIRSGSLTRLNDHDQAVLAAIPVKNDLDLRSNPEVAAAPDRVPAGATYRHLPVFAVDETDASHSDEEIAQQMQEEGNGYRHMLDVYRRMASLPSAKKTYQEMFKVLLTTTNGATLFHCTAGKDRTGFAAFLILSALGVPRETIIKDYLLTNEVTADVRKKWLAGIRKNSAGLGNVDAVVSNRNALASVNADYLNTALATIKEESGDVGHYLTDYLGLSKGDLTTLRHLYLD
ncbi:MULTISPECIES: tyrosine-protein phosphatase [Limosilactobacillus]|uniref:Protein tyrosine serine phosphatase n=1 Tax=Limosilactobacillus panis DSM 6035 TaxID=1423782 RepID=A0A0R1XJJ6_9LACO|nr:tyrosine-protein phosphatase [Limosilactobacillus panis]KRM26940.1 hypothetical protein FD32_GL000184 [Limosilactobacillus panis DSM 6035]